MIHVRILIFVFFGASTVALAQSSQPASGFPIHERLRHYVHRTYSWQRMALLGADTLVDHILVEPHEWGRRPASYTFRYSSAFGRRIVRNSIELGAGIALGEDARFKPSQKHTFLRRLRFASENSVLALNHQGNRQIALSRLAATVGGILIASTWHPCRRSPEHVFLATFWRKIHFARSGRTWSEYEKPEKAKAPAE